ncbi:16S rRNA (cytosine(967)-C(5))-methyltransferase [hydrothermal vent metagenome]|uniref:16S rRNA (Cytosine(967)-C(5))-methyltransferase n=1 Tax=hydrothermal vent metagenome TaxID=652676 RepID=A0A3B0U9V9_9ZZZZ
MNSKKSLINEKPNKSGRDDIAGLGVRQQAALALSKVLKGEVFEPFSANEIANSRDRALANRLVTMSLRRHGHLDQIIKSLLDRGVPKRSGVFEAALRIGLTQLLFLPDIAEHSAIHLAVETIRQDRRASRFDKLLNGVLRQAQRESQQWLSLENHLLFPSWIAQSWAKNYGDEALEKFGEALLQGAPLDLTLKEKTPDIMEQLGATETIFDSVRVFSREKPVHKLPLYDEGEWWVQDVAATIAARLFTFEGGAKNYNPKVLDMCAAPGGKTAQLAKTGYEVTALDNSPKRLQRLRENFKRLKYLIETLEADANDFSTDQKFDGILIDAPCTASGVFRRHPEVLWQRGKEEIADRVALQQKLISSAVKSLVDGGQLIYCVCSLHEDEGESQVNWVSKNFPQLQLLPITEQELDGLEGAITHQGYVRTHAGLSFSNQIEGAMDGFFIARWRLD